MLLDKIMAHEARSRISLTRKKKTSGDLTHQQIDLAHRQARQRARTGSTVQQKGNSIASRATRDMQSQCGVKTLGPATLVP